PDQVKCRGEELALEGDQCGYVARTFAPPGFGTTTKCPQSGTRGVEEDAVESRLKARIAAVGGVHGDRQIPGRVPDQPGAMPGDLHRGERGPLDLREPPEHHGLTAGPGTQVQPPPTVLARQRGTGRGECHELTAL